MYCKKCGKYINGRKQKVTHKRDCGEIVSSVRKLNEKQRSQSQ